MFSILIDYFVTKWQRRCKRDNRIVSADILEGGAEELTICWCRRCGALHAAATAGEWEYARGGIYCNGVPVTLFSAGVPAWIVAAHNHYPALREEIRRLREENVRLSDLAVQRANMIAQMDSKLATAKRDGAVEELRRLADEWAELYSRNVYITDASTLLRDRADELEGK